MNIKYLNTIATMFMLLLFAGCDEMDLGRPKSSSYGRPDKVSNVIVIDEPGASLIKYKLPASEGLRYVVAEYNLNGKTAEVKASNYDNSIRVDGFAQAGEYDVTLYAVSWTDERSEPVIAKIHPQEPPYIACFKSLVPTSTFGGVYVQFENPTESDLKITVLMPDSLDEMQELDTYYTSMSKGSFAVRGLQDVETRFGFLVRDKWNNYSDTMYATLTPLFEMELDKKKFSHLLLPGDVSTYYCSACSVARIWDGIWNVSGNMLHTYPATPLPLSFAIDFGVKATLSRMKHYFRYEEPWRSGAPKIFEIWGSNNPSSNGSWDSWTMMQRFEEAIPSGNSTPTAEDNAIALVSGYEMLFDPGMPAVRYIRFKMLANWSNNQYLIISELTFFGQPEE